MGLAGAPPIVNHVMVAVAGLALQVPFLMVLHVRLFGVTQAVSSCSMPCMRMEPLHAPQLQPNISIRKYGVCAGIAFR
jgi:hypothetical protein